MIKKVIFIISLTLTVSCTEDNILSPDINDSSLLPDTGDYLDEDYGTQDLANEIAGTYNSSIGLVIYDSETRTEPVLYLTRGDTDINIAALKSGAVEISYYDFQTVLMPLKMSVKIKGLIEEKNDTIYIRGTDGIVRTKASDDMPIGTPLPESDDAELTATYIRDKKEMGMLIDLMLPIPVKALVKAKK
ncbi:MAG: hypothetical protein ACK5MZ_09710 [Aestuariibaculum sp.]